MQNFVVIHQDHKVDKDKAIDQNELMIHYKVEFFGLSQEQVFLDN